MDNPQPLGQQPPKPFTPSTPLTPPQAPRPFTPPAPKPFTPTPTPPPAPRPMPTPPPNIPMGPSNLGNMEVRTMASDIKSVQETGGGAPRPYVPPQVPSSILPSSPSPMPSSRPPMPPMPPKMDVRPIQQVQGKPSPAPAPSPMGGPAKKPAGGSKKGIFTLIISLVIVVGAGVIGYFFVFPLFSGGDVPAPVVTPTPLPPSQTPDEGAGLFEIPSGNVTPEEIATPPVGGPEPVVPAPASTPTHVSYLSLPSDLTSNITIEDVSVSALRDKIGFKTAQVASLKEIVLTRDGDALRVADLGPGLLPQLFTDEVTQLFEPDFTYVLYTDAKGSWPVYVFHLNSSADATSAKSKFAGIEQVSVGDLHNLYLSSPGGASGWKDGTILGTLGRYNPFTLSGASLNYVWIDNFVVLGTNYAAIQEAVKRLGS